MFSGPSVVVRPPRNRSWPIDGLLPSRTLDRNDGLVMRAGHPESSLVTMPRKRIAPKHRVAPLRVADLEIDALHPRIHQGTRELRLSPGEHILLYTLAARAGAVVRYREIAHALGRADPEGRNNTLARHLSSLRRKLRDGANRPRYIETVLGVGYRFVAAPAA
jgi:DNA-binding response OmpR family regulator